MLIADEPTTALDVTIQAQVLEVMDKAQDETGAATIMITHDLGVVAGMADDILVMYAGCQMLHHLTFTGECGDRHTAADHFTESENIGNPTVIFGGELTPVPGG